VQVLVPVNGEMPLGKRYYWPIYAAAERHGLPVAVHCPGSLLGRVHRCRRTVRFQRRGCPAKRARPGRRLEELLRCVVELADELHTALEVAVRLKVGANSFDGHESEVGHQTEESREIPPHR
jgi:hypothetical protein